MNVLGALLFDLLNDAMDFANVGEIVLLGDLQVIRCSVEPLPCQRCCEVAAAAEDLCNLNAEAGLARWHNMVHLLEVLV